MFLGFDFLPGMGAHSAAGTSKNPEFVWEWEGHSQIHRVRTPIDIGFVVHAADLAGKTETLKNKSSRSSCRMLLVTCGNETMPDLRGLLTGVELGV